MSQIQEREVMFTWPQTKALRMNHFEVGRNRKARSKGLTVTLDIWDGQELYERARSLPSKSTREFLMKEALIGKLSWAKPPAIETPLAVSLGIVSEEEYRAAHFA